MAKASIQPIYDRMNSVENYHPFTADTYADWSLEAGDIVTVSRDGKSLTGPVHNATVRWTGKQKVSLESRGEKERGSIAKMSARAFNSGGNGGGAYRSGGRRANQEKDIYTTMTKNDNEIKQTAVDNKRELESSIKETADTISVVVEGTGKNAKVKPAVIEAAITDQNGYLTSSIKISAAKIMLDGTTSINDIMVVGSSRVSFLKPITVSSGGNVAMLGATGLHVGSRHFDVTNIAVNGNVMTITYWNGETRNFSKATTLEGSWSSSTRRYKVTAYQNNGTKTEVGSISTTLAASIAGSDIEWDDTYWGRATIKAQNESGQYVNAATNVLINAKTAYDHGKASVPTYSHSATITFEKSEELPSGTMRYHYYTTGTYIITSGTKTVHYN